MEKIYGHPTIARKLDIFLYDGASEGGAAEVVQESSNAAGDNERPQKEEPADWKHVLVIAEVNCEKGLGDLNRKVVLQLAGYARHVFQRQPNRQLVHGFTVVNATLRCWLYTRSGAFASSAANLTTVDGAALFCRVFNGYFPEHDKGAARHRGIANSRPYHGRRLLDRLRSPIFHHACDCHSRNHLLDCAATGQRQFAST